MWLTKRGFDFFSPIWDEILGDDFKNRTIETYSPAAHIIEKIDSYIISVIMPGINKEDIYIEVKDNFLIISGEKKDEKKEEKDEYYHYESSFGKFSRSWHIEGIEISEITADFNEGILKIILPKKEETISKNIALK